MLEGDYSPRVDRPVCNYMYITVAYIHSIQCTNIDILIYSVQCRRVYAGQDVLAHDKQFQAPDRGKTKVVTTFSAHTQRLKTR
jgi:hypothetical protein